MRSLRTPDLEKQVLAQVRAFGAVGFQIVALRASRVVRAPAAAAAAAVPQLRRSPAGRVGGGDDGRAAMSARARSSLTAGAVVVLLLWTVACVQALVSPAAGQERALHSRAGISLDKR